MTTAASTEVQRRRRPHRPLARTPFEALADVARRVAEESSGEKSWAGDRARYRTDPVAFAVEVLGETLWSKQVEILQAAIAKKRVAVKSGHKVGKSRTAAILALWFYCCFDEARVVMSSTTARQVDAILWREVRKLKERARRPIPGEPGVLARTGLKSDDYREIVGFTAREAEAVAGISGANLLYLLDEASGIPELIFEAIQGNMAGGARIVMFSNPTRTEGLFFEAFHEKEAFWHPVSVSSEETPNAVEGRAVIPGLATREWIDEMRAEWGEDSAFFKVRVQGEFVLHEDGKIFSIAAITEAEERWADALEDGKLHIGVDPAGPAQGGDETAFALRRGAKVLQVFTRRGLSEEAHIAEILGVIKEHRRPHEPMPIVAIDREGPIGGSIYGRLRGYAETHPDQFEVVGVRSSDRAGREPHLYDRVRDELWANLVRWLAEGGAIPTDVKLEKELHAPEWVGQVTGRLKVTPKDEIRKQLGRSPDRADALALAVWQPAAWTAGPVQDGRPARAHGVYDSPKEIDAYELDGVAKDPVYG